MTSRDKRIDQYITNAEPFAQPILITCAKHCDFGFRRAKEMKDPEKILEINEKTAMGSFGKITSMNDLPSDKLWLPI